MDNNGKTLIIILVGALLLAAGAFMYFEFAQKEVKDQDTTAINVEVNEPEDEWRFATTTEYSIQYPADLGLGYVRVADWPPMMQFSADEFVCLEAGEATARSGLTESVTIGGREYCRTVLIEGAAGSTYTQYAYAFEHGDDTAILTFSTRAPQCANYDEEEMRDCEAEIADLDIDDLADRIARTLRVE